MANNNQPIASSAGPMDDTAGLPPSYDATMTASSSSGPASYTTSQEVSHVYPQGKPDESPADIKRPVPSMSPPPANPTATTPLVTVYHYVHPITGERIDTLLPPDHPEMLCLQAGGHDTVTRFGILGVLAAVFWFPLGVGLCLLDRRVRCKRCGAMLSDGYCD